MMDEFLLDAVLLLFAARIGGFAASKLRQSAVLGEMLAGMIVGPYVLGLFNATSSEPINIMSNLGMLFLMFLVGFHIDFHRFEKFFRGGVVVALFGFVLPIAGGLLLAPFIGWSLSSSYLAGAALAATSVGVTSAILFEQRKSNTRAGITVLDAAVIDDVYGVLLLGALFAVVINKQTMSAIGIGLLKIPLFFLAAFLLGRNFTGRVVSLGQRLNLRVEEGLLSVILMFIFLGAYAANLVGLSYLVGAFMIGLMLEREGLKKLGRINHEIYSMSYGLFIPIFFAFIGANINPAFILSNLPILGILFAVTSLTKFAGAGIGSLLIGLPWKEAAIVGVAMVPRLEVATIITQAGLSYGLINVEQFSLLMATFSLTILLTPFFLYPLLKK